MHASPARNDYWVQLPLSGHLEATVGRDLINCNLDCAWIALPTRQDYYAMRSDGGSACIHPCLNKSAISHQLEGLLDEPSCPPLEFAPTMDLTTGDGNSLARIIRAVVTDLSGRFDLSRSGHGRKASRSSGAGHKNRVGREGARAHNPADAARPRR